MQLNIIRAWKDETYRQGLNDEQLRVLPENPAGQLELTDADLQSVSGGWGEGFDSFGGSFFGREDDFINSHAFACENPIFSNNNIKKVVASDVRITNICVNFD